MVALNANLMKNVKSKCMKTENKNVRISLLVKKIFTCEKVLK